MKIEPEHRWVKEEDCGKPLTIAGFAKSDNEKLLYLLNGIESIQMSIYGKNFNLLYNTFGNETENWIGKVVYIKQEKVNGKNIRTIYTK